VIARWAVDTGSSPNVGPRSTVGSELTRIGGTFTGRGVRPSIVSVSATTAPDSVSSLIRWPVPDFRFSRVGPTPSQVPCW
jgi:hypothetical protein